jgi:hypothetical protein
MFGSKKSVVARTQAASENWEDSLMIQTFDSTPIYDQLWNEYRTAMWERLGFKEVR